MAEQEEKKPQLKKCVIHPRYGGGPHGVGDPDDKFLRKVEKEICIPQKMRERARIEKCVDEVKAFTECGIEAKLLLPFKCRPQNDVLKSCLTRWYYDPDFREECTQMYLEERSEFRRTGIGKKMRRKDNTL